MTAPISFQEFIDNAQTGDLVLWHGGASISWAIELWTGGFYSHASMVVVLPSGQKTLWQAAGEALELDPEKGTKHTGAQLGDLAATVSLVYHHWQDVPYYRPLDWDRPADLAQKVVDYVTSLDGRPFPPEVIEMILSYEAGVDLGIDLSDLDVFCSELVAMTYHALGLLPAKPVANSYSPNDFSSVWGKVVTLEGTLGTDTAIDIDTIPGITTMPEAPI